GLRRLACVDHVRADTSWVGAFRDAVHEAGRGQPVEVLVGVEAKFRDAYGGLDLPANMPEVDVILAADHRLPFSTGSLVPRQVKRGIRAGYLTASRVIESVVTANIRAMEHYRRPEQLVLAHLFSILPKIGMSELQVRDEQIARMARVAWNTGTAVEVDERWRCPGPRALQIFHAHGVQIYCSSDAHSASDIGHYDYVRSVALQSRVAA
ncbi:MAG: putative hydrolase, partial [Myxococcota bacterium]